jgi:hypothetical protein
VSETVSVCVDCLGWLECGPEDPYWVYSEGYSGPRLLEGYWATQASDSDGEPLEPYFGSGACGGCGSGLAGDRVAMAIGLRGEGQ